MGRIKDLLIEFEELVRLHIHEDLTTDSEITELAKKVASAWLDMAPADYSNVSEMDKFTKSWLRENQLDLYAWDD